MTLAYLSPSSTIGLSRLQYRKERQKGDKLIDFALYTC
jgi:hypothetical protein